MPYVIMYVQPGKRRFLKDKPKGRILPEKLVSGRFGYPPKWGKWTTVPRYALRLKHKPRLTKEERRKAQAEGFHIIWASPDINRTEPQQLQFW